MGSFCEKYNNSYIKPLVGISTTFHLNYSEITRLVKQLKQTYPNVSIVLGGAFINNQLQLKKQKSLMDFMKKYSIDFTIHNFNSDADLKNLILRKKYPKNNDMLNNLITNTKQNDHFIPTKPTYPPQTSNNRSKRQQTLKFPFMHHTLQLRTSSGCPFHCAFCSYPGLAEHYNTMPIYAVEQQLQAAHSNKKIKNIIFIDDTFNVPIKRFKKICQILSNYNFNWFSFLRVQFIDENTAKLMKQSGCQAVYLGIESANNKILKNMNKQATQQEYIRGINYLKKYNITIMAAFVIGFPGETPDTLQDNIDFIENLDIDFYTLKEFFYIKNTTIYQQRENHGLTGIGSSWSHNTMNSDEAYDHKISMLKQIKNSIFIDPDTSLWYIAYLFDRGFSMEKIASLQKEINTVMIAQINGDFNNTSTYKRLIDKINCRHFQNVDK